ncbi:hypothetical protein LP7551_03734 [Roseibium album]|nr:hypothetical protein LP7551_03734 [Roseibium album]
MPIYEFSHEKILPLHKTTFSEKQLHERRDLQRLLRENISVIAPDTLVIAEEYSEWDSRRRIDLLGVDRNANLVVIELKRTEDGGHMELQAVRYASMVSTMTFDHAVGVFHRYLSDNGKEDIDAEARLLEFLDWEAADHEEFAQDVKIVLASAEFSRELTSSVLWLVDRDIDITCVRLQPYDMDGRVMVDVQQIIPLPEVAEYQVQVREKARRERVARTESSRDHTRFNLKLGGETLGPETKRRSIYLVFRYLVDAGIDPEKIAERCGPRSNRALYSVEGEVSRDDFLRLAQLAAKNGARKFDRTRYYCADDDLIRRNGRTYAFSNQWGGADWADAMSTIKDTFDNHEIDYAAEQ